MLESRWPRFAPDEVEAAAAVLRSGKVNYWTGGEGRAFEREFAAACGVPYAIALANGTLALEGALRALGVGPGDEVVVTPRSFIASASCVVTIGARPVFADVDPVSQNLTAATIAAVLTRRTRAVICVHLAGWACEMAPIMELAKAHALAVVEDCAQAHGATHHGRPVGSFGDVAAFSFCQDKIMTTGGEGGMLVTRDEGLWERAWSMKDHGKRREAAEAPAERPGFRWLHGTFGSNWRLTEMQAAIGRVQHRKLEGWVAARRKRAAFMNDALGNLAALRLTLPDAAAFGHAYYKFYCFVRPSGLAAGWSRDRIMAEILARGVPCFTGSCPEIYREEAFAAAGLQPAERLPVARELGETSLMFQVDPSLSEDEVRAAARTVRDVALAAGR